MKYFAIFFLLLVVACQPQEIPMVLPEAEKSAVMEASNQYSTAILSSDFDQMRSLLDSDVVLMPTEDTAKKGADDVIDFFETGPDIEGSITPHQVEGSGDLAYVRGNYSITFIVNDTLRPSDTGKYVEIYKKQDDGSWRVILDIWNSDLSPEM